jgi:hypothetical protein
MLQKYNFDLSLIGRFLFVSLPNNSMFSVYVRSFFCVYVRMD